MAVDGFTDFFVAAAGASAALTGLLFVAVSVSPNEVRGPGATVDQQVRAGTALTALGSPLVVALVGLLPGSGVAVVTLIVGASSAVFAAVSFVRLLLAGSRGRRLLGGAALLLGIVVVAVLELWAGTALAVAPNDASAMTLLGTAIIVSLVLGVNRAWSLVGAPGTQVIPRVWDLAGVHSRGRTGRDAEAGGRAARDGEEPG